MKAFNDTKPSTVLQTHRLHTKKEDKGKWMKKMAIFTENVWYDTVSTYICATHVTSSVIFSHIFYSKLSIMTDNISYPLAFTSSQWKNIRNSTGQGFSQLYLILIS